MHPTWNLSLSFYDFVSKLDGKGGTGAEVFTPHSERERWADIVNDKRSAESVIVDVYLYSIFFATPSVLK